MRVRWQIVTATLFAVTLCACGPSAEQMAQVKTSSELSLAQARSGQITWVEHARRTNQAVVSVAPERFQNAQAQAFLAYRVALGAEVDAKRLTPEQFEFTWRQKLADIESAEDARRQAAFQQMSNGLIGAGAAIAATGQPSAQRAPVQCSSDRLGTSIVTNCY